MPGHFCEKCKCLLPADGGKCPRCGQKQGRQRSIVSSRSSEEAAPRSSESSTRTIDLTAPGIFPYTPRTSQMDVVAAIRGAMASGEQIAIESGTGTGKTVCALVGVLEYAKDAKKKVIYLTRTISQSDQVVKELRSIAKKRKVTGLPILGRAKSCMLVRSSDEFDGLPPNALSKLCEEKKRATLKREKGGCPHYADYIAIGDTKFAQYCLNNIPTAEEFDYFCELQGACPYEARKEIMGLVDVLIMPYVHIISEDVRKQLFDRLELTANDLIVVVDEAHNLADAARESESIFFRARELETVNKEMREYGDPVLVSRVKLSVLSAKLRDIILEAVNDQISQGRFEAKLGRKFLEGKLRSELSLTEGSLDDLTANLNDYGENVVENKLEKGEEPVSSALRLSKFLSDWFSSEDSRFVKIISAEDGGGLEAFCIEPRDTSAFLQKCYGVVHMSGTLQPLKQYVDIMDLPPTTLLRTFPSPFPPENRMVLYVEDVNPGLKEMREDPSMKPRIEDHIISLCNATSRNTMVFFRSYDMMNSMRARIETEVDRKLFFEGQGSVKSFNASIEAFKKDKDGVFLTVMGGKVSEGIDFPGGELDMALIVGLPFPPPSLVLDEMKQRFDRKYGQGKGWEYTSMVPALRKVQQAIGRLIRTESDRGAAVILDSRVSRYREQLGARPTRKPVNDIIEFFGRVR